MEIIIPKRTDTADWNGLDENIKQNYRKNTIGREQASRGEDHKQNSGLF